MDRGVVIATMILLLIQNVFQPSILTSVDLGLAADVGQPMRTAVHGCHSLRPNAYSASKAMAFHGWAGGAPS
jgi:hypothetical protein